MVFMHIAILGRQPALGIAELESVFGGRVIKIISANAVSVDSVSFDIQKLGGVTKAGIIIAELSKANWHQVNQKVVQYYLTKWSTFNGKITLGISVYGFEVGPREVQKTGIILKQKLKKSGVSLRLIPNPKSDLSSAISHHNKLGLSPNKVELLIVRTNDKKVILAESTGSQNITAYANRDQIRPMRDSFVGMLPPKLAQIMINMAIGQVKTKGPTTVENRMRILDPFCGTGVILQEAALMRCSVYGTDLSEKMVRYSRDNLDWLVDSHHIKFDRQLHEGDATSTKWQQPIDAVVSETYLGQPFSAAPSPPKLEEVKRNCDHIITEFLKNLYSQIEPGTPVCIAVPAWRNDDGSFTHLRLISTIAGLGYIPHEFANVSQNDLLYYRADQVVARELLVLKKT
jgi:tRNA (guanine10-N2)-dimethyltransferase